MELHIFLWQTAQNLPIIYSQVSTYIFLIISIKQ